MPVPTSARSRPRRRSTASPSATPSTSGTYPSGRTCTANSSTAEPETSTAASSRSGEPTAQGGRAASGTGARAGDVTRTRCHDRRCAARAARRGGQSFLVHRRVLVVRAPVGPGEARERVHLRGRELEGEHVEVLALAVGRRRLGQRHDAELHVPAQDRLDGGDAVGRGDRGDDRVAQQVARAADRAPRLGEDPALGVGGPLRGLREVRVQLDLVHERRDARRRDHRVEVVGQEVRDAHVTDQPALAALDERLVRLDVPPDARVRPVDQVQVDPVETGAEQRLLDGADGVVVSLVAAGEAWT